MRGGTEWWEYLNSLFFLVAAVILGMFASYSIERSRGGNGSRTGRPKTSGRGASAS